MINTKHNYFLRILVSVCLLVTIVLSSSVANASETAWQDLKNGKAVAVMRHAFAPDSNEPTPYDTEKCKDERNLSLGGAQQARDVATVLRSNGINTANVYSSSICRCVDTGILFEYGKVNNLREINSYYGDRSQGPAQTAALTEWIKQSVAAQKSTAILVTHGLNVSDLLDTFAEQGEVLIVGVVDGRLTILHRFTTPIPQL